MVKLAGVSSFTWKTTEQVYPFEKASDGSTLYCKEVNCGTLPNNGQQEVAHNITFSPFSNTKLHSLTGRITATTDPGWTGVIPYTHPGAGFTLLNIVTATNITFISGAPLGSYGWQAVARLIYAK